MMRRRIWAVGGKNQNEAWPPVVLDWYPEPGSALVTGAGDSGSEVAVVSETQSLWPEETNPYWR